MYDTCSNLLLVRDKLPFLDVYTYINFSVHGIILQKICSGQACSGKTVTGPNVDHSDLLLECDQPLSQDASIHQVVCSYVLLYRRYDPDTVVLYSKDESYTSGWVFLGITVQEIWHGHVQTYPMN